MIDPADPQPQNTPELLPESNEAMQHGFPLLEEEQPTATRRRRTTTEAKMRMRPSYQRVLNAKGR